MAARIALFVEGRTEMALPGFLHRWLDPQAPTKGKPSISAVRFEGVSNYLDDVALRTEMYLQEGRADVVVGLVDLYGLPPDRIDLSRHATVREKVIAARSYIRGLIPARLGARFRQHFAVHETEAWLLAYPDEWPATIRPAIERRPPEDVNFNEPPAKFLKRLMGEYKKTVCARSIFSRVDPGIAIGACPYLRLFAEDLLYLAKALA